MSEPGTVTQQASELAANTRLVHLSSVIKRPFVDQAGEAIGKVQDLIVRVGERPSADHRRGGSHRGP